jgi:hypothetical protein
LEEEEYLVLISIGSLGSRFVRIGDNGTVVEIRDHEKQLYDLDYNVDSTGFVCSGFDGDSMLLIQGITPDLVLDDFVLIEGVDSIDLNYSTPKIAVAQNSEIGIGGNIIEAGLPVDYWFQKIDSGGIPVPVRGKTFKFMGIKLGNEMIPSEENGFALTGFWQEDENKPKRLMFATVDSTGKGYLKAITALTNFIGCDIVTSHAGGYGILAAQGTSLDESIYDLMFMHVDLDGGPVSFSGLLHSDLKQDELHRFPPCIIQVDGGYVVASYFHNGNDYDIMISWLDISGKLIMKKETIRRDGDQFVTDIIKLDSGGFIIIGAEKTGENYDAMIIKTDPFGKID